MMKKGIRLIVSLFILLAAIFVGQFSYAQEGNSTTLVPWNIFRAKLKYLANNYDNVEKIKRVSNLDTLGDKTYTGISLPEETEAIAWWNESDKTIYYYTEANTIYLNESSVQMFSSFSKLKEIDMTQFNTSKVTDMDRMFATCSSLTYLDLRTFDTSSVNNMTSMFNGCSSLTKLDLGTFDTRSSWLRLNNMFRDCTSLKTIYVSDLFDATNIGNSDSANMFFNATNLKWWNGTTYSSSHITWEYAKIDRPGTPWYFTEKLDKTVLVPWEDFNIKVKQLANWSIISAKENQDAKIKHFREWNLSQKPITDFVNIAIEWSMYPVDAWYDEDEETIYYYTEADEIYLNTDSSWMFYQRNAVEDIDTSKFNTSEVENMQGMFNKTYKLQELDLRWFNTDKVTSMQSMFNENKTLKVLDLSSFDTSEVKTMEWMFNSCEGDSCSNLETVYVSSWFSTDNLIAKDEGVFKWNNKLVWWNWTKFSGEYYRSEYARIDNEWQSWYFTDIYNITVRYFNIDDDKVQYKTWVSKWDKVTRLTPNDFTGRKVWYSLKYYIDSWMSAEFDFNQPITKYTQIYTKWEIEKSSWWNGWRSGWWGRHNDTTSDNTSSDNNDKNSNKNQDNATDTSWEKSQSTAWNNQSNKSTCAEWDLMCIHSWAYDNQLTKYNNIKNVKFDSLLKRQEMAKISSIFATKFYWKHPDESKKVFCSQYADLNKVNSDMKYYIVQSCELGLMWYKANGTDALEKFRPYSPVSLAELSIIISRIMWWNTYALGEKQWYQWHLRATYEADIVDNINNPSRNITRWEAFEMFYRTSSSK